MATAASLARGLDARRQGFGWRCPCPLGCGYTLSLAEGEDGKLLAYCFGGCDFNDVFAALVEHGLFDDAVTPVTGVEASVHRDRDDEQRIETACRIYDRLTPAAGTIAEGYLRSRSIAIVMPSVLRFGTCPHRGG